MNEQDKQFLACLCVWLDWNIYQTVKTINADFPSKKSFEEMRLEAQELVKEFSKLPEPTE